MVQQNSIFVLAMAQRCTLSDTLIIIIRNIRAFRDQTLQYPFQAHEAGHRVLEDKGAMAETRILLILRSSQRDPYALTVRAITRKFGNDVQECRKQSIIEK